MRNSFFVLVGLLSVLVSNGQSKINSPYSIFGLGDLQVSEQASTRGMGHVGVSRGNMYFTNTLNPALLQRSLDSELKFTITDFGFYGRSSTLKTSEGTQNNGDVNLNNISLLFPISKRSSLAFGLKSYSSINYRISSLQSVGTTDEATITSSGTGGLNKLFLSDGFRIINDHKKQSYFSIGAEASYVFGTIEETITTDLASDPNTTQNREFMSFSDVDFKGGLSYRRGIKANTMPYRGVYNSKVDRFYGQKDTLSLDEFSCEKLVMTNTDTLCTPIAANKLKKHQKQFLYLAKVEIDGKDTIKTYFPIQRDLFGSANRRLIAKDSLLYKRKINFDSLAKPTGTFFNFGFVYEHNSKINGNSLSINERLSSNNSQIFADTTSDQAQQLTLPRILRFGISIDKPKPYGYNKYKIAKTSTWSIGLDVAYNQWDTYSHFNKSQVLSNTIRTAIGGEYSPNPATGKWMERWIYRAGFSYEKLPYDVDGTSINELGITFGTSIPLGSFSMRQRRYPKYLNVSVEYGKRGTVANGLVEENYFITTFSLTANSKWFTKRKIGL